MNIKNICTLLFLLTFALESFSQRVNDFTLKDVVSGNSFSLSQHQSSKAVVLIFTTNTCPFSKLYEDRIMELVNQYQGQNFRFVLVNPQSDKAEGESSSDMVNKVQTKMSNLPYLADGNQSLTQTFGITKIPAAVVITSSPTGFAVAYQGSIDNNPQLPQSATRRHLKDALQSIVENKTPSPASTRPVGCNP